MTDTDFFRRSTEIPSNQNRIEFNEKDGFLRIFHKNETEEIALMTDGEIHTADQNAEPRVKSLFKYMEAFGRSKCVIFGQENNLQNKAGNPLLSHSDTFDMTDDYPAVQAFDVLAFTGVEFSAQRLNARYAQDMPGFKGLSPVDVKCLDPVTADIEAAAALARREIELGSVFSLSAHMPNFLFSKVRDGYVEGESPAYSKYNYREYTPNRCEGSTVQEVMPGGSANDAMTRYLDLIAAFAKSVGYPFFFRPLHENTGSWFWWGKEHCTPEEFKALWHYIVDYLKNGKNVHNLLYAYSPGSENENASEYCERYPGDDYVDLVGVDMYDPETEKGEGLIFFERFKKQLAILEEFSSSHGKLMAVTETGLASSNPDPGCNATSMHITGNLNNRWHSDILEIASASRASYFLLWANFSRHNTYYTPFVDRLGEDGSRIGHEALDDFIRFYNDERSIFASHQIETIKTIYDI